MKKRIARILIAVLIMTMAVSASGCSKSKVPKRYDYDLSKYVKLGQYEGLEYEQEDRTVTDEDVRAEIDLMLEYESERVEKTEGTVKKDSVVNIDYEGSVDGETREEMTAEDQDVDIADSGMIPGFAEGLVGHKVGEEFDLPVTFPDPYLNDESLSGKPAVFKIKINCLVEEVVPEYNEEYVKEHTEYETVEEYEASVRADLEASKNEEADDIEQGQIFQQILDNSEILEYPEKEMAERKEAMIQEYKDYAEMYGMEYSEFLEMFLGLDEESFDQQADEVIKNTVKQELVLYALAKELDIKVSDKEYSDFLDGLLEDEGLDRESFEEETGQTIDEYAEDYNLYESYLYQLVMEKLMEMSVAK